MSQKVWNQGRVVGYSGYELYVKNFLEKYPDQAPASERQWMASMLGMGASMLLKVKADNISGPHIRDIVLPEMTALCACNTIVANLFCGEGYYDGSSVWATRVKNYGQLISNDAQSSPSGNTVPSKTASNWSEENRVKLKAYLRILDGVVIQPGEWKNSEATPPTKDLMPDILKVPTIRLLLSDAVETDFEILLTGFTSMKVAAGSVGLDGSNYESGEIVEGVPRVPDNDSGDFLGPAEMPWSNKILFHIPTAALNYFMIQDYKRTIDREGQKTEVDSMSVIDMKSLNPRSYYRTKVDETKMTEPMNVDFLNKVGDDTAVITVWSRSNEYPPALWGTMVQSTGRNYLCPLDVVAPGVVKMFDKNTSAAELKRFQDTYPGTFALRHNADGTVSGLTDKDELINIAFAELEPQSYTTVGGGSTKVPRLRIETGTHTHWVLPLHTVDGGGLFKISSDEYVKGGKGKGTYKDGTEFNDGTQPKITPATGNINWATLLSALANDQAIDILGPELKALKVGLASDPPYIPFKGIRLYLNSSMPNGASIPEGSIGIGW